MELRNWRFLANEKSLFILSFFELILRAPELLLSSLALNIPSSLLNFLESLNVYRLELFERERSQVFGELNF